MRICIIGKFPPIEGGVSTRTYWTAHALAARGHDIHVITNAKEAAQPFRMHMRAQDWERCAAEYEVGAVTVHWTDPLDRSQFHIPMASPFVSKLAGIAARVHAEHKFDVLYSHYIEPYGVAGHLAAQMTAAPHVVRMAGSDAGRLWHHPQLEMLYDHVLRAAEIVVAEGVVAARAIERGVNPDRIASGGGFVVPEDVFTPFGPALNPRALTAEIEDDPAVQGQVWGDLPAGWAYFGVYGKLGDSKGSFALLSALARLKQDGIDIGLVALAHGRPAVERRFRETAHNLDIADRVLQLPFLPNWRVSEFVRGCLAVCCLEQDFPIAFHTPIMAREVLLCGGCLVASTETIRKLPGYVRLPHGYGCVAIEDIVDAAALSRHLAAIVEDPQPAASVGARGYAFARQLQQDAPFPDVLERVLETAAARRGVATIRRRLTEAIPHEAPEDRFPLTRLAQIAIGHCAAEQALGLELASEVLTEIERRIDGGGTSFWPMAEALRIEIAIAKAEEEPVAACPGDPLFRLRSARWAVTDEDIANLKPMRAPNLRVVAFEYDASEFLGVRAAAQLPAAPARRLSHVVAFARSPERRRQPLLVDAATARILLLSDGTRTVSQIVEELGGQTEDGTAAADYAKWIENLFVNDLLWTTNASPAPA